MLRAEIKLDETNLDLVYPLSLRAAVEEREKQQAEDALKRISEMGDKLSKSELKALMRTIQRAQPDEDADENGKSVSKARHHHHHKHAASIQQEKLQTLKGEARKASAAEASDKLDQTVKEKPQSLENQTTNIDMPKANVHLNNFEKLPEAAN